MDWSELRRCLPDVYFERMDADDVERHLRALAGFIEEGEEGDIDEKRGGGDHLDGWLDYVGDIEEFSVFPADEDLLRQRLRRFRHAWGAWATLLRIVRVDLSVLDRGVAGGEAKAEASGRGYFIVAFYRDVAGSPRASEFEIPTWEEGEALFRNQEGDGLRQAFLHPLSRDGGAGGVPRPRQIRRHQAGESGGRRGVGEGVGHSESVGSDGGVSGVLVGTLNSSVETVTSNLLEIFESHEAPLSFLELWEVRPDTASTRSFHMAEALFSNPLHRRDVDSMAADVERYLQARIRPRSVFDLIGPAMVGPSSSHTAGANRIGQLAREILRGLVTNESLCPPFSLSVQLLGSFRDTGVGHRTPAAVGGGLRGHASHDPGGLKAGEPQAMAAAGDLLGVSGVSFSGYEAGSAADDERYRDERNNNIVEVVARGPAGETLATVVGFSIGGGNVEVRYLDRRLVSPWTGEGPAWLLGRELRVGLETETDGKDSGERREGGEVAPLRLESPFGGRKSGSEAGGGLPFNTFEELCEYAACHAPKEGGEGRWLLSIIHEVEERLTGRTPEEIQAEMERYWRRMETAAQEGLQDPRLSPMGLTGNDSNKLAERVAGGGVFDNLYGRALVFATAISEHNAKSGSVVACPTAGACGILPGILAAYRDTVDPPKERLVEALLVAGFLGMVFFDDVSTAGADFGCQAEVGAGAAMAAGALAHLEGGRLEQVVQAFTLAIKNCMGLVCDPVAGLVEVPCVKRNGIYTSVAISAAFMALAGVKSAVSPDEVVLAVREVGDRLHRDYKETAGGGLAKTRDGKRVELKMREEVQRWMEES